MHIYLIIVLGSLMYICMSMCVTTLIVHNRWEVEVWRYSISQGTFFSFIHYERQATVTKNEKRRKGQQLVYKEKKEKKEANRKNTMSSSPPIITCIQPLSHFFSFAVFFHYSESKEGGKKTSWNLPVVICIYIHIYKSSHKCHPWKDKLKW